MPYYCAAASEEAVQVRRDAETAPAACAIGSKQLTGSMQSRQASEEQPPPTSEGPSKPAATKAQGGRKPGQNNERVLI